MGVGLAGCPAPAFARYDVAGACDKALARMGAPIAPSQLYVPNGSSCSATGVMPEFAYYQLGADIAIPALTRTPVADPPRRLWPIELTSEDLHLRDLQVFDSALGADCTVATTRDGVLRCVPGAPAVSHLFTDPGCTLPIAVALVAPSPSCTVSVPAFAVDATSAGTPVYRVGAPYTGRLYAANGTTCSAYSGGSPYAATELDPTALVAATVVTDP